MGGEDAMALRTKMTVPAWEVETTRLRGSWVNRADRFEVCTLRRGTAGTASREVAMVRSSSARRNDYAAFMPGQSGGPPQGGLS
jgi:hypothetical protein